MSAAWVGGHRLEADGSAVSQRAIEDVGKVKNPESAAVRREREEPVYRPRFMHRTTYERWRQAHDNAEERSAWALMNFVERLGRRTSRRRMR
jgi:hypothetical protein